MKKSAPPTKVRTLSCKSYYNPVFIKIYNIFNKLQLNLINLMIVTLVVCYE